MEHRHGYLREFYDYSKASRSRIRRVVRNVQNDQLSSDDEAVVDRQQPAQRALLPAPGVNASSTGSSSNTEHHESSDEGRNFLQPDPHMGNRSDDGADEIRNNNGENRAEAEGTRSDESENVVSEVESEGGANTDANDVPAHHPRDAEDELRNNEAHPVLVAAGRRNDDGGLRDYHHNEESSEGENNEGVYVGASSEDDEEAGVDINVGEDEHDEGEEEDNYEPANLRNDNGLHVYDLAPITLGESMYAILSFFMRHKLSLACLSDLLSLIDLHCRQEGNHFTKTVHNFKKFFQNVRFPLVRRYYCSSCCRILHNEQGICGNCNAHRGAEFFIEIPIIKQLRALYNRPDFRDKLNYRLQRRKFSNDNYEDIYDGAVYQELIANDGILSDPRNISLMWYTDGVSIFRSSRYEIWPFYFVINELPYNDRTKISNALLAGLWFGVKKPIATTFLQYIRNDIMRLRAGIDIQFGNPVEVRTVRALVICGTADMPAKAKFLNFKGPKSYYGCPKCKVRGQNLKRGVMSFSHQGHFELRTEASTLRYAERAVMLPLVNRQRQDVFGVKGPSILSTFVHQHVRTAAVDVMHCAYLNLAKALLQFWFDSKFHDRPFSLSVHVRVINSRLSKLSPPNFVQRLTRTLKDVKYWKAHELKDCMFYYSLPVLSDKMRPLFLEHHKLLVLGLYLLNQRSISREMVDLATELLDEYVAQYGVLYGHENMTCNLHHLLHLGSTVLDTGPLWVTSCAPFEDLNGKLKKLVKGTRYAELQICSSVSMLIKLSELKTVIPNGRALDFADNLFDTYRGFALTDIGRRMFIIGSCHKLNQLSQAEEDAVMRGGILGRNYFEFHRLLKYCIVYVSQEYGRTLKTKSYCVKYRRAGNEEIGFITRFIRVTDCECLDFNLCQNCNPRYIAIIRMCVVSEDFHAFNRAVTYIHTLHGRAGLFAVDVMDIVCLCFIVPNDDLEITYIVEPVNLVEAE